MKKNKKQTLPTILVFDIETSPLISYTWGLFDQNVSLNQVKQDWHLLSWSAKYFVNEAGEVFGPHKNIMYMDNRAAKDVTDDSKLLKGIWELLDSADIVLTQNGNSFDLKKLNARFALNKMAPPAPVRKIDTLRIARKHFAFTSNKLEYLTDKLCTKYKKLKPKKFAGFELWKACLAGNKDAWKEMETYNKHDVLSLEELYQKLQAWDNGIDLNVYNEGLPTKCSCGSTHFRNKGKVATNSGIYTRYVCTSCNKPVKTKVNELSPEKRKSLKPGENR